MAPEALRKGTRLSYGLDIYGLGLLSYQALLGMPAFLRLYGTPKPIAWARWLLSREKFRTLLDLEAPVTPALSAIIEKMLEKDLKQRYQKLKDLRQDLERLGVQLTPRPQAGPSLVAGVRRLLPALLARPSDEERQ
jgi:serine/threonine protein kinase